jgi:hypothetical protein
MDKTIILKGWIFCENQRVSAENFNYLPQKLADFRRRGKLLSR